MMKRLLFTLLLLLLLPHAKAGNSIVVKYAKGNFATEFSITWIENGEILFATSAFAVDAYRSELEQTAEGRDFLDVYDKLMIAFVAYQGGKIVAGLPDMFNSVKTHWQKWSKLNKPIKDIDDEIAAVEKEIEKSGAVVAKGGSKTLYSVDKSFQARDEAVEVFINGKYKPNPTATTIDELTINPSGTVKGKKWLQKEQTTEELLNGSEYMYVIDENDRLIIGTRVQHIPNFSTPSGKAPHPTLIGGADPKVQAAGTIEFRGGKIYKIDNASGHYKPSAESLKKVEEIFKRDFPANSFTNDFKGFIEYGN